MAAIHYAGVTPSPIKLANELSGFIEPNSTVRPLRIPKRRHLPKNFEFRSTASFGLASLNAGFATALWFDPSRDC